MFFLARFPIQMKVNAKAALLPFYLWRGAASSLQISLYGHIYHPFSSHECVIVCVCVWPMMNTFQHRHNKTLSKQYKAVIFRSIRKNEYANQKLLVPKNFTVIVFPIHKNKIQYIHMWEFIPCIQHHSALRCESHFFLFMWLICIFRFVNKCPCQITATCLISRVLWNWREVRFRERRKKRERGKKHAKRNNDHPGHACKWYWFRELVYLLRGRKIKSKRPEQQQKKTSVRYRDNLFSRKPITRNSRKLNVETIQFQYQLLAKLSKNNKFRSDFVCSIEQCYQWMRKKTNQLIMEWD